MATYGTVVYNGTTYTLYGYPGSTLRAELNRLANGGASYPAMTDWLDEQAAANKWAGVTDTSQYLATSYTLNKKYNIGRAHPDFKDLNGVCSELAGLSTTDPRQWVEAVAALRIIPS